jgi:class 3 adenylate cyclase/tetratricopeptide (TPR) repeat protein
VSRAAIAPSQPVAEEPLAERRMCSVLFCDLVGFTPLSESRDPEEVREMLTRYFDTATTVVRRYGGVIEKFIGDAVMAVWGTPIATEEDAERTVRAALDLVEAVHQLGVEIGAEGLTARAGVITGEVAVTIGATNEGMIAGDAVNTAARIQSTAAAGTVFVDATTRRLAASAITFNDEGEHELKGKLEPQHLWRAVRVVSSVGGVQRVDGLEAPLTGRDAEMRAVRELFHASVERRQTRLVLVTGPAGVGKSRLGWEFEKYIDGLADPVLWHRGRCLSYGEGLVFWALAEVVRQRLGIAEEDSPQVAADKLVAGLERHVDEPADRILIGTRVGRLIGVPFTEDNGAALARDDLFAGWRRFLERLAASDPVTLLIEDAHHADPALLDFIDHLVDWTRDLPIYVLVFARPEIEQRRPGFGSGRNRARITLDPLDPASMEALVDALVPGAPDDARNSIVERAQGIPLYAVESIRALIDRDVVRPVDGVYRVVGDIGELEIPDSLHALLAARLDVLAPQVRHVLTDAAVLGSTFPAEAVVAVSGLGADTVAEILSELLRREVLEVSADPLSPERGSYRFSQEMLRQVAYETLSRRDRKARHLRVAAHLRNVFPNDGDEVSDVVARHYTDALEAVPDDADAGEVRELAIESLVRAGEKALRSGAPSRSMTCFWTAADLVAEAHVDDQRHPALLLRGAEAAMQTEVDSSVLGQLERAIAGFRALGEHRTACRASVVLGRALRRLGRMTEARVRLTEALVELRSQPDLDTVDALQHLAALDSLLHGSECDALSSEALTLTQALDPGPSKLADVFLSRAIVLDSLARQAESAMYLREAARLAGDAEPTIAMLAALNLGNVLNVHDPSAAAVAARQSIDISQRSGVLYGLNTSIVNLAIALMALGDWDEAERALHDILPGGSIAGDDYLQCSLAWFTAMRGRPDDATSRLEGLQRFLDTEDPQDLAMIETTRAFIAEAEGQPARALEHSLASLSHVERGLTFSNDDGRWVWPLAARSARALGDTERERELLAMFESVPRGHTAPIQRAEALLIRARLAADDGADAGTMFVDAIDALRACANPFQLAHGLLDHATYLATSGDLASAREAIGEARSIAVTLDCGPLSDRIDRLTPATAVDA